MLVPPRGASILGVNRLNRCGLRSQARLPLAARNRPSKPKTMRFWQRNASSSVGTHHRDVHTGAPTHYFQQHAYAECAYIPLLRRQEACAWHALRMTHGGTITGTHKYTRIGPALKKDGPHVPLVAGGRGKRGKGSGLSKPRGCRCHWYPVVLVVGKLLQEERVWAVMRTKTGQEVAKEQHQ